MKEYMEMLSKIINKIADVFEVFDFSYVISGSVAYMIIYAYGWIWECDKLLCFLQECKWYYTILIIYVLGLLMFTFGRWFRQDLCKQKDKRKDILIKYKQYIKNEEFINIDIILCKYWDNLQNNKEKS